VNNDEILLFLYKDVGLLWEHTLSQPAYRSRLSLNQNNKLRDFIRRKSQTITYYITNRNGLLDTQKIPLDTFYLIESSGQTRVGSLLKHIRNSIMHGKYTITSKDGQDILNMEDFNNRNNVTMKGRVSLERLKELIQLVK